MALTKAQRYLVEWRADWNKFVRDVFKVRLDQEQQDILYSVQTNPRTAVASGTARGKDFVTACAVLCFLYLTPRWDSNGKLIANTKVAITAPTDRQIKNIMVPEYRRLFRTASFLPGRLVSYDIRMEDEEWFLTGFKASDDETEAWSGFHAVNTMFAVTEASGISETTYNAIEGNLQGNSRLLIVFNPNTPTGYAANAMKSERFAKFRLDSLNAENVVSKRNVIPGQVDYNWVSDKVKNWCMPIDESDFNEGEGDFKWEGGIYRPNDLFRIKVRGMFPKAAEDMLIPYEWIVVANRRWKELMDSGKYSREHLTLGVDVAGMGRDASVLCPRYDNIVPYFKAHHSAGKADHMHIVGLIRNTVAGHRNAKSIIDTIGEGAGVYSRLIELGDRSAVSCKFSFSARDLTDVTGQYEFSNMRAYLYWAVRDWLNPKNNTGAALPECDAFAEEATQIKWFFQSNGSIAIEKKEEIKKRLKRSTDYFDALANTFYDDGYSDNSWVGEALEDSFA